MTERAASIEADLVAPGYRRRHGSAGQSDSAARLEPFPFTDVQKAYLLGRERALGLGNETSTCCGELETADRFLNGVEAALNQTIVRHDTLHTVGVPDGYQWVIAHVPHHHIAHEDIQFWLRRDAGDMAGGCHANHQLQAGSLL
jgi:nonribosomal peptide synthetase protein BlmIV